MDDRGPDPFRLHPELRPLIGAPERSFFRDLGIDAMDSRLADLGFGPDWRLSHAEREASRRAALAGHAGPLWIFAYGSLMWDPSMRFDEVRLATAPAHVRHFCLWDEIGRGTPDAPGLMAALDAADPGEPGCHGIAFRIPADLVEEETRILWRRERIAEAYRPVFIALETAPGPFSALAFLADPRSDKIRHGLPADNQAAMITQADGVLGPCRDYVENLVRHLRDLGIDDPRLYDLHARVRSAMARTRA